MMDGRGNYGEPLDLERLLYRQYQEQSLLCDAVIKTGLWEKRFHWCVLVGSPFFDNIYRSDFLEKQTGTIELNKWPAPVVEMALLFLYGGMPTVTDENFDILMDIAEFLLIPQLKLRCVEYLDETKITLDNCMQLYELSNTYGFILEDCDSFIRGNLPEVLEQEQMMTVTGELLKSLLADPTLSYVTVQTWFRFLVRWVNKAPERQDTFVELLNMLDFNECDKDFLNNVVAKEPVVVNATAELMERLISVQDDTNDTVLIFSIADIANELRCLNMRTMIWYKINLSIDSCSIGNFHDYYHCRHTPVAGVKGSSSSCIYKVSLPGSFRPLHVITYDLNNALYSVTTAVSSKPNHPIVNDEADDDDDIDIETYAVGNDRFTAVSRTQIPSFEYRSTLCMVKLDEPVPKLHAVLTLKDHSVSALVCSNTGLVAMLTCNRENLFIYNDSTAELDCIRLKHDHGIEINSNRVRLAAVEDDFVLHDNDTVVCVSKLSGACLETKYDVKQITLEKNEKSHRYRILFDGDLWFRISCLYRGYGNDEVTVEFVSHKDLVQTEKTASLYWKRIPIPPETNLAWSIWMDLAVFRVSLRKGTIRCHLNCPHCRRVKHDQKAGPGTFGCGICSDSSDDDEFADMDGSSFDDNFSYGSENYDYDDDGGGDDDGGNDDGGDDNGVGNDGGGGDDRGGGDDDDDDDDGGGDDDGGDDNGVGDDGGGNDDGGNDDGGNDDDDGGGGDDRGGGGDDDGGDGDEDNGDNEEEEGDDQRL